MKEIVLDTETTGLSVRDGHRIVEIGCIELDNLVPTKNIFHFYLNPERKVSEKAFQVHGYSDEFLATKQKFADIADDFLDFINDKKIIIHNAEFDIGHLNNELSLIGAKSNLNGDTLPTIDEFTDHKQLVNSALITAQDLHGRLVASLRNNETEVANTLISAIELNKKSEISFFNDSLLNFQTKYKSILENIEKLP